MKTVTAKELRIRAAAILERVRQGDEVTITTRGKPIAIMKPLRDADRPFNLVGYGMWKDRKEIKEVNSWLDERRSKRYLR